MKYLLALSMTVFLAGCSVFGHESVETAPYQTIAAPTDSIEIRDYPPIVMAVTSMTQADNGDNKAFKKLFDYISGNNIGDQKIAMTAPVIMSEQSQDAGEKIAMTAPVFIGDGTMAFVLPEKYTYDTAPKPKDDDVMIKTSEIGKVAVITFNGLLDKRADAMEEELRAWIENSEYTSTGNAMRAGYNSPWAIPITRRNEVLIPVVNK